MKMLIEDIVSEFGNYSSPMHCIIDGNIVGVAMTSNISEELVIFYYNHLNKIAISLPYKTEVEVYVDGSFEFEGQDIKLLIPYLRQNNEISWKSRI